VAEGEVRLSALFGILSPRAIRAAVLEEERSGFEWQFREAMAVAAATLDLSGVEELLLAWQRIAELTASQGRENRRQILVHAVRVWRHRDHPDPDGLRRSDEFYELLRQRLTPEQRRQVDAGWERIRCQVAAGEPVTDSPGRPMGVSEPYTLVPLDELPFDDVEATS
jgi:hypothetical protein